MKKIAVESDLSNIREYLTGKGYDVFEFQHNQASTGGLQDADAIVASGMDKNFTGMHDIKTEAMIIDASGLTPQQIAERIEKSF